MNDGFKKLLARCKCGVFLIVNEHRDYYETAEQKLEELEAMECPPNIDADVRKVMIETDTIVSLQFYPDTPIGSYSIYHYDVDAAIERALRCLD